MKTIDEYRNSINNEKDRDKIKEIALKCVKDCPDEILGHWNLYLHERYKNTPNYLEAKKYIEKVIELDKLNSNYYYYYLELKSKLNEDFENELKNIPRDSYMDGYFTDFLPINKIEIENYFSIKNIKIDKLGDKKEIYFLGENGDGKTILLQAISLILRGNEGDKEINEIYKKYNKNFNIKNNRDECVLKGENILGYELKFEDNYVFVDNFSENEKLLEQNKITIQQNNKNTFGYGLRRAFIKRNSPLNIFDNLMLKENKGYLTLFNLEEKQVTPEEWLKQLYFENLEYNSEEKEENTPKPLHLETAKNILKQILDKETELEIKVSSKSVEFIEKGTKGLDFNQLSEGYRSLLSVISDLVYRLSRNQPYVTDVEDYRGIVLIDEIGAYLHPKWEISVVEKLRTLFPKIQWIFTTHSPVTLLGASKNAVFYKLYKNENGETEISQSFDMKDFEDYLINGFLTSPLFDLPSSRTNIQNRKKATKTSDFYYDIIHEEVKKELKNTPAPQKEKIRKAVNDVLKRLKNKRKS